MSDHKQKKPKDSSNERVQRYGECLKSDPNLKERLEESKQKKRKNKKKLTILSNKEKKIRCLMQNIKRMKEKRNKNKEKIKRRN